MMFFGDPSRRPWWHTGEEGKRPVALNIPKAEKKSEPPKVPIEHLDPVISWRFDQLVRAGFGLELAFDLARVRDIDIHRAMDMVDAGADHQTVWEILR